MDVADHLEHAVFIFVHQAVAGGRGGHEGGVAQFAFDLHGLALVGQAVVQIEIVHEGLIDLHADIPGFLGGDGAGRSRAPLRRRRTAPPGEVRPRERAERKRRGGKGVGPEAVPACGALKRRFWRGAGRVAEWRWRDATRVRRAARREPRRGSEPRRAEEVATSVPRNRRAQESPRGVSGRPGPERLPGWRPETGRHAGSAVERGHGAWRGRL